MKKLLNQKFRNKNIKCALIFLLLLNQKVFSQANISITCDSAYFTMSYLQRVDYVIDSFDMLLSENPRCLDFIVKDLYALNGEKVVLLYDIDHEGNSFIFNKGIIIDKLRNFKLLKE